MLLEIDKTIGDGSGLVLSHERSCTRSVKHLKVESVALGSPYEGLLEAGDRILETSSPTYIARLSGVRARVPLLWWRLCAGRGHGTLLTRPLRPVE